MSYPMTVSHPRLPSKLNPANRQGINRQPPLSQALDLQEAAYNLAVKAVNDPINVNVKDPMKALQTRVKMLGELTQTWALALGQARIIRGHGNPKPVEAINARKHVKVIATTAQLVERVPSSAEAKPTLEATVELPVPPGVPPTTEPC